METKLSAFVTGLCNIYSLEVQYYPASDTYRLVKDGTDLVLNLKGNEVEACLLGYAAAKGKLF